MDFLVDFFKAIFEEQLEFDQDEKGNAVFASTFFTPVQILEIDSIAYKNEFLAWLSDRWLPEQNERLDQLLKIHANRKRFSDLCTALKNGHLVPLIGSGMSVSSGLQTWSGFLRSILCYSTMAEDELNRLLGDSAFEEAIEQIACSMPKRLFDERIEHDLRIDPASINGAIRFLPELFDRLVLTTNLDNLLELLYADRERDFSHILAGSGVCEYRNLKASSERVLLKLHGDYRNRKTQVLSKNEYEKAYESGSPVREELMNIYRNKNLLCIGCSLGQDRTVSLLSEVAKMDEAMPRHYAFLQQPTRAEIRIREHFLTERDIFPIWYEGDHDECIQTLFVGMLQYLGKDMTEVVRNVVFH
jgi:hypothetical protein